MRTSAGSVGRDRYVLRWIRGNPYIYLRQYLGARSHSKPRLRDVFLGRVAPDLATRGSTEQLSAVAYRLRRRRVAAAAKKR